MNTRNPVDRGRSRLVLMLMLVACLALAGGFASTRVEDGAANIGSVRDSLPMSLTTVDRGVVDITTRLGDTGRGAAGTGMVLDQPGEVLTNNHVIQCATEISVAVPGGSSYPAVVVGTDPAHDVALVKILGTWDVAPTVFGDSSQVAVGDPVTAVGNAGGVGGPPSVASGTVTGLNRSITTRSEAGFGSEHLSGLIQSDADIQPGDSGGPLINAAGQAIGMNTAAAVDSPRDRRPPEGYAIPINSALDVVRGLESGQGATDTTVAAPC